MNQRANAFLILCLALTLGINPLAAQTNDDASAGVRFDFSTPGARSLGLGGTFIGSVDDASAAYSNPAGLLQLSAAELMVELRHTRYSLPYPRRGRASGIPTGLGIDTLAHIESGRVEHEVEDVSYAAFVLPRSKWAFSLYYQRQADFSANFETEGLFAEDGPFFTERLFPARASYHLEISQVGTAFAWKHEDWTVGVGISYHSFVLDAATERFALNGFEAPSYRASLLESILTQNGDAQELGLTFGLLAELSDNTRMGLVYRIGPEFDLTVGLLNFTNGTSTSAETVFNLPDFYGVGISHKRGQNLTINLDVNSVQYSELAEGIVVLIGESGAEYVLDNAVEIHLGVEYLFSQSPLPIAFRAGLWWDPEHRLRAASASPLEQARLPAGEDVLHVTAGLGLILGSHFQIDAAVDISDQVETAAVSLLLRF